MAEMLPPPWHKLYSFPTSFEIDLNRIDPINNPNYVHHRNDSIESEITKKGFSPSISKKKIIHGNSTLKDAAEVIKI